jgi:hypothetical protein
VACLWQSVLVVVILEFELRVAHLQGRHSTTCTIPHPFLLWLFWVLVFSCVCVCVCVCVVILEIGSYIYTQASLEHEFPAPLQLGCKAHTTTASLFFFLLSQGSHKCFAQAGLEPWSFWSSLPPAKLELQAYASVSSYWLRWESSELFAWGWPWTAILPIWASPVARITDVSHHTQPKLKKS